MPFFRGKDGLLPLGFLAVLVVIGVTILPVQGEDGGEVMTTKSPDFTCILCLDEVECADPKKNATTKCPQDGHICYEYRSTTTKAILKRSCIPTQPKLWQEKILAKCTLEHLNGCRPAGGTVMNATSILVSHLDYKQCYDDGVKEHAKGGSRAVRKAVVDLEDPAYTWSICYCTQPNCNKDLTVSYPDDPADSTDEDDGGNTTSLDKLAFLTLLLVGGGSRWWWSVNQNL